MYVCMYVCMCVCVTLSRKSGDYSSCWLLQKNKFCTSTLTNTIMYTSHTYTWMRCDAMWCIQRMDHDCALVPRGALVVDASKRVIESAHFDGLSFLSAGDKRSYMHCRPPESLQGTYVTHVLCSLALSVWLYGEHNTFILFSPSCHVSEDDG